MAAVNTAAPPRCQRRDADADWSAGLVRRDQKTGAGAALRTTKAPRQQGFREERMKGLEPSTFCMASRRSSQLSYIRARAAV
jgi:hypothetical protein